MHSNLSSLDLAAFRCLQGTEASRVLTHVHNHHAHHSRLPYSVMTRYLIFYVQLLMLVLMLHGISMAAGTGYQDRCDTADTEAQISVCSRPCQEMTDFSTCWPNIPHLENWLMSGCYGPSDKKGDIPNGTQPFYGRPQQLTLKGFSTSTPTSEWPDMQCPGLDCSWTHSQTVIETALLSGFQVTLRTADIKTECIAMYSRQVVTMEKPLTIPHVCMTPLSQGQQYSVALTGLPHTVHWAGLQAKHVTPQDPECIEEVDHLRVNVSQSAVRPNLTVMFHLVPMHCGIEHYEVHLLRYNPSNGKWEKFLNDEITMPNLRQLRDSVIWLNKTYTVKCSIKIKVFIRVVESDFNQQPGGNCRFCKNDRDVCEHCTMGEKGPYIFPPDMCQAEVAGNLNVGSIAGILVGVLAGIILVTVMAIFIYCKKKPPTDDDSHIENWQSHVGETVPLNDKAPVESELTVSSKRVLLLFTCNDHLHNEVVNLFATFLKEHCLCEIHSSEWCSNTMHKQSVVSWVRQEMNMADWIVVISSQEAYQVYHEWENNTSMEAWSSQDIFRIVLKELMVAYNAPKIITVHFPYTPQQLIFNFAPLGKWNYKIPDQLEQFFLHIHCISHYEPGRSNHVQWINGEDYTNFTTGKVLGEAIDKIVQHLNSPSHGHNGCNKINNNTVLPTARDSGMESDSRTVQLSGRYMEPLHWEDKPLESDNGSHGIPALMTDGMMDSSVNRRHQSPSVDVEGLPTASILELPNFYPPRSSTRDLEQQDHHSPIPAIPHHLRNQPNTQHYNHNNRHHGMSPLAMEPLLD